ncbi:complex I subunit 5 family protein [Haloarcula onubensis]|uniref:Na+/H+ antiporter subunit D n=1 Tax=Haloarcula onubensis TaxID=2950539 RepID=A0ABU2FLC5_9EURY|nr:proton-conducting transporter membrane subunit [Halomicroarcula sp. S3CR25-11]MDS0281543.1 Na+/H+ antiporter subunit D [Halomicroarcula sp. S3CR25-11]
MSADLAVTTTHVVVAPMLVALLTAVVTLATRSFGRAHRLVSLLGIAGYAAAVAVLADRVLSGGTLTYQLSAWPAPFGITLVADALAAFMLSLAALVTVALLVFSVGYMDERASRVSYHPLFHFMLLGVTGAFLTGDVFNLFVWFEVMLMPSYVFVVFYGGSRQTAAALQYTVLNLVGSALMLVAIGGLYATTGTLNMADMARRLAAPEAFGVDPAPVLGLAAILLVVFALKAGVVPFQFWVPPAYRAAPAPISAFLAGVTKKVGVYAIIRLYFTVFAAGTIEGGLGLGFSGGSFLAYFGPVLFVMALASIVLGGLGAVSRTNLDDVFAYSSIGQVGFIVLPLAMVATVQQPALQTIGIVAALVYSLNHAVAKAMLFLVSGTVYDATGTIELDQLGGLTGRLPVLSGAFFVGSLALIGIPPLSGFFGKLLIFDTGSRAVAAGEPGAALALAGALVGAIFTIAYLSRTWSLGFWGAVSPAVDRANPSVLLVAVVAALALTVVAIGVGFDPVYGFAESAARAALDTDGYVEAVDPGVVGHA